MTCGPVPPWDAWPLHCTRALRPAARLAYGSAVTRLLQLTFWLAALFTLVMALLPKAPALPGAPSDKLQHVAAFLTLAVLARLGWPRHPLVLLLGGLALFGAAIELGQLLPVLNRHAGLADWAADVAAAAVGLALAGLGRRLLVRA